MKDNHFLQQIDISAEKNRKSYIYKKMLHVFNQHNRLLILCDETLAQHAFDGIKKNIKEEHTIYIPLAKGNSHKDTNLFFIEVVDISIFDKIFEEIAEHLLDNFEVKNDHFVVHGFGTSHLSNEKLNQRFKKSLVLKDLESKVLFRWYDPRVMIYLENVFSHSELNSLLSNFSQWCFSHPTGCFYWGNEEQKKIQIKTINKINKEQSLTLDLIEVSNIVFRTSHDIALIDINNLKPNNIIKNLYQGYEQFKITKYVDLVSYGLYAEALGHHFMKHPIVKETLQNYWGAEPEKFSFNEAMSFLDEESWSLIKNQNIE